MTKVIKKQSKLFYKLVKLFFLFVLLLPVVVFYRIFSIGNHNHNLISKIAAPKASADMPVYVGGGSGGSDCGGGGCCGACFGGSNDSDCPGS